MGHIIPAGTGFDLHRNIKVKALVEVPEDEPAVMDITADEAPSVACFLSCGAFIVTCQRGLFTDPVGCCVISRCPPSGNRLLLSDLNSNLKRSSRIQPKSGRSEVSHEEGVPILLEW